MDSTQQTSRTTAPLPTVWTLTIVHHPNVGSIGRRLVLEEGASVTLGRELAVLDGEGDRKLSRAHARVGLVGDAPSIEDAGSRNGTFVDGVQVSASPLREDSVVGVGGILLACQRRPPLFTSTANPRVVAVSAAMSEVLADVAQAAVAREPVMLIGETGVGKGLLAEELHLASGRAGPFVAVHCATLADERLHAQLFGEGEAVGLLASAHGGTLFLDGVDDARPSLQAALLSFLDHGEVRRVGEAAPRKLDVRVVASSRRGPRALLQGDRVRGDFLARFAGWSIEIPPLRARREDVGAIAASFTAGLDGAPRVHHELALALLRHEFPANVRELHALLGRIASLPRAEHPDELRADARAVALLAQTASEPTGEAREGFVVARHGGWFDAPDVGRVSLDARKQLERILGALAAAHRLDRALSVPELVAAGWPGERVLPRAGASRVYVSITSLRKMGLRDALERTTDGYRLASAVAIE